MTGRPESEREFSPTATPHTSAHKPGTLEPGFELGSYEILGALGAGGMGEVYRARDQELRRDVAIKVLPEAFARDSDRLARFQREAKRMLAVVIADVAVDGEYQFLRTRSLLPVSEGFLHLILIEIVSVDVEYGCNREVVFSAVSHPGSATRSLKIAHCERKSRHVRFPAIEAFAQPLSDSDVIEIR